MWWHKGFMASSDSVHPHIWVRTFHTRSHSSTRHRLPVMWFENKFRYRRRVADLFPFASHVVGWKEKSWTGVLRMNRPVWEQRLMCGLLVSNKDPVSHSVQTRADTNLFCFQNVLLLLLRWTASSDFINKALFLNKTLKDGSFNIFRVQWD